MLKKIFTSAAILVSFLFVVNSYADISGSAHDFSGQAWSGGRICIVCHTPHHADTTVADSPLWNHDVTTSTFDLYSGNGTLDATVGQPDGVSKLCLSCHDGTVAVDSFGGTTGTTLITGNSNLGTDLSNDHPISFTYDAALATADGELVTPQSTSTVDGVLPLFNGKLECASCHDVHNTASAGNPSLLLDTTAGSALCLRCHDK